METVNDTAMHVTETKTLCSSLTCPKSKSEEITKEKEEELLYGSIEDGDEEDALSDDSIRLRVSDDEADLDEPSSSTNMNMNNDKAERKGTYTELASVIPSKDTSERMSSELSREKLSNGLCTFEMNTSSRISEEKNFANDDFASDVLPKTDNFFGVADDADCQNGDIDCGDNTKFRHRGGSRERSQANRNPMIDYLRRGNHNSLPRQSHSLSSRFASNSYNDRYYNKKYYGGGKGSGRGYNGHSRDSHDMAMDSKYTPRIFPSEDLQKGKNNSRNTSPTNIKIKANDKDTSYNNQDDSKSSEIGKSDSNHVSLSDSTDFVKNRESIREDKNEISKNDNAEVANNSLDSKDSTSVSNETSETTNLEEFTADKSLNSQKNEVNVKCETDVGNVSFASDETFVADEANDIAENLGNEQDELFNEIEPKIGEDTPKSTTESKNSAQNPDKVLETNGEDDVTKKPDEFTEGMPIVVETSEVLKTNETSYHSGDKVVETKEVLSENTEEEAKTIEESKTNILDRQKLGIDEKSMIASQSEPTTEKQLIDAKSQETIEHSVVTDDIKTIEKSCDALITKISSEPKISEIEHSIADLPDEKESSSDEEGEGNNVTVVHSSLKRSSRQSLDEMELSKRIRIQRKKSIDSNDCVETRNNEEESASLKDNVANEEKNKAEDSSDVNPVINSNPENKSDLEKETSVASSNVVETSSSCAKKIDENNKITEDESVADGDVFNKKIDDCEVIEVPVKLKQKRLRRSLKDLRDSGVNQEDTQEKENVRQKRRTARNAEEIIRKEFLGNSDSESNDSAGKFVAVNYNRTSNDLRAASPPSLKRNLTDDDEKIEPKCIKKLKHDFDINGDAAKSETLTRDDNVSLQTLNHVRHFFRRDNNGKLAKLKQEELEELLIQKVVETITMRDEIGKLRDQAMISERNQEATRVKCQQLSKQIKDFEMVLNRYNNDRRSNPDKTVIVPIKINRSVGLQVNFVTDHGIQNLRQLGQTQKAATPTVNGVVMPQRNEQPTNPNPVIKRTVKVRSPRRAEPVPPTSTAVPTALPSSVHNQQIISNITPAALVVAKSVQETRTSVTTAVQQANVSQLMATNQTILVNGLTTNTPIRQTTMQVSRTKNNSDLIDLTQEEDKTKTTVIPQNAILTTPLTEAPANVTGVSNIGQRYHTVIQAIPGSVAITAPTGIRVVQPSSQPTPTALVNNMNAPRLAYVMQSGIGGPRQVVFTSTPTPIRPAPDHQNRPIRTTFPISGTITNGTVRVIPTSSTATLQVCKHPAALPESINPPSNLAWKLPPPAPSLKISKVANGIVLSWNMALSDKFADIASYQLYAYQEVAGIPPSSTLWKKVGDVRALPLPMACTLTQFSEGNNYYFAVRAVDRHSRLGMYSQPGNISL